MKIRMKTLIFLGLVAVLLSFTGCKGMTNEYTGKTYHSVSEIAKEARVKLEEKYEMSEYDLTVLESHADDTGGFFGTAEGVPVVKMKLEDSAGKQFTAYYAVGRENPALYDDYQYDEILADFKIAHADEIVGAEKVVIQYNVLAHEKINLLSETEVYTGDLSMIDLSGVRVEYIDEDISNREVEGVNNYLYISFDSKDAMDEVSPRLVSDWFRAPLTSIKGIQAVKDNETYIEYYTKEYGDYAFVSPSEITVTEPTEDFDVQCLSGHGSIQPESVVDPVTIIYDEDYSIYIKASVVLDHLVSLGYEKYNIDPSTEEGDKLLKELDIPVGVGYKYWYNDGYSYHTTQLRYQDGYFTTGNVKPKYDTIQIYVDLEFLKK